MEKIGTLIGRYQLVRVIGRGAMGVVYEGTDTKLHRQVAVKAILKTRLLDQPLVADYMARFEHEARVVARLSHPNIVTVFDFVNEADMAYLVMEFIRGAELKTYLDQQHIFSIAEAVAIVCELLEALDYAHNNGIIHRDIKPANVMLDSNGRVKLTDFGVACLSDGSAQETSQSGVMVGTPSYMSPEQIQGLPAGVQSDLFATGVVLYQCLSLHKPFVGNSEWELWQTILNDAPPPLAQYRSAVPAALEQVMLTAMAKNPQHRPLTARAFIDDLQAAMAQPVFDPDATRAGPSTVATSARAPEAAVFAADSGVALATKSNRTPVWVVGCWLVVLFMSAAGVMLLKKGAIRAALTTRPAAPSPVSVPVPVPMPMPVPAAPQSSAAVGRVTLEEKGLALKLEAQKVVRAASELAKEQSQSAAKESARLKTAAQAAQVLAEKKAIDTELKLREATARELALKTMELNAQKIKDETAVQASATVKVEAKNRELAPQKSKPPADPDALFTQAQHAEKEGRLAEAVAFYKQAYSSGNGRAARMLGDIYGRGNGEVGRDYGEQLQWYDKAKAMGVEVPVLGRRKY